MNDWQKELGVVSLSYGIVAGAALLMLLILWPFRSSRLLPLARFRDGFWTGGEVIIVVLFFILSPQWISTVVSYFGFFRLLETPDVGVFSAERKGLWVAPLSFFMVMALSLLVLYAGSATRPRDLGLTRVRWLDNVRAGILAFLIVTPIVLGVFLVSKVWLGTEPHSLQTIYRENLFPGEWGLIAAVALIFAPLLEEWLMRGILLGWLRRASLMGHLVLIVLILFVGGSATVKDKAAGVNPAAAQAPEEKLLQEFKGQQAEIDWPKFAFVCAVDGIYAFAVFLTWAPVVRLGPQYFLETAEPVPGQEPLWLPLHLMTYQGPIWDRFRRRCDALAIVGSTAVFSLLHLSNWPAPIALLLLALVLGWLAVRTQSLVAPITLHVLFNAVATLGLFIGGPQ